MVALTPLMTHSCRIPRATICRLSGLDRRRPGEINPRTVATKPPGNTIIVDEDDHEHSV